MSRWFPDQTKERVEFSFREAILKYGLFDKAYVDYSEKRTIPKFSVAA